MGRNTEDSNGQKTIVRPNNVQTSKIEIITSKELLTYLKKNGTESANGGFLGYVGGKTISSAPCFLQDHVCPVVAL